MCPMHREAKQAQTSESGAQKGSFQVKQEEWADGPRKPELSEGVCFSEVV